MWLSASKRLVLTGLSLAALMLGQPAALHAQSTGDDATDDLRLDTLPEDDAQIADEQVPPVAGQPITIGDDLPEPQRRRTRAVDPYEPLGLRMGAFTVFPTLEMGAGARLNNRNSGTTETQGLARLRPSLRAESDWSRHQLTFNGSATLDQTFGGDATLSTDANLGAAFRLDVRRGTTADFAAGYVIASPDSSGANDPVEHTITGSAAISHDFGPVAARLRLGATRQIYEDVDLSGGGTEDNSDRAYTELSVALRGSLTRGAVLTPFAEIAYEPRFYDKKTDRNGIERSSQGLRLSAGLTISDDPIWSGEVAANVLYRSYDDASLDDVLAPGLTAAMTWRPTDLTRFEFNASVALDETVAIGESATVEWRAGYSVAHNLRENLVLSAGASLSQKTGASDTLTLGTELGLSWAMNRNTVFGINYSGEYTDGATGGQEHSLIGSIILRR